MDLSPPFRIATPEDAPALARFIAWASHGMAEHVWTTAVGPERAFDYGTERMAKRAEAGEWIVADEGAGAVAGLSGYAIPDTPEPIAADMEAMFVPLQELENAAPASWYVHVLAALPEARGKGWGTRLLALAGTMARESACDRMSIIVDDTNTHARRLYERVGFVETARRPMIKGTWQAGGSSWVLMTKDLTKP